MSTHAVSESVEGSSIETDILREIMDSEKKAEEILENAKKEKESVIQRAIINSSKLLAEKEDEMRKAHEKKIMDFRDKSKMILEEKLADGKTGARDRKSVV